MLRVVQVTKDNKDAEGLRQTYEAAFPKEERVPYDELFNLPEPLVADVKAYYIGDTFITIFVAYVLKKFNYPAYLAVVENLRNKGYGKTILTEVLFHYTNDKPFLGDVESPLQKDAPNLEMRKRRHAFYLRSGIMDTGKYCTVNGVEYTIMTTSKEPVSQEDIDEAIGSLKPFTDRIPKI